MKIDAVQPWSNEPDFKEIIYKEFDCYIKRGPLGTLCGYVFIPTDHPILKKNEEDDDYDNIPLKVHGGLTYGNYVTHKESGKKGYVVGFDCGHYGDLIPDIEKLEKDTRNYLEAYTIMFEKKEEIAPTYKDINFVTKEIESMVDQLIAYKEEE